MTFSLSDFPLVTENRTRQTTPDIRTHYTKTMIEGVPLQPEVFYLNDYSLKQATGTFMEPLYTPENFPWHDHEIFELLPFGRKKSQSLTLSGTDQGMEVLRATTVGENLAAGIRVLYDEGFRDNTKRQLGDIHLSYLQNLSHVSVGHQLFIDSLSQKDGGYLLGQDSYRSLKLAKSNPLTDADHSADQLLYMADIRHHPDENRELSVTPYARLSETTRYLMATPGLPTQGARSASLGFLTDYHRPYSDRSRISTGFSADYTYGDYHQHQASDEYPRYPEGDQYRFRLDGFHLNWQLTIDQRLNDRFSLAYGLDIDNTHLFIDNRLEPGSLCDSSITNCMITSPDKDHWSFTTFSPVFATIYRKDAGWELALQLYHKHETPNSLDVFRGQQQQNDAKFRPQATKGIELSSTGTHSVLRHELVLFLRQIDHLMIADSQGVRTLRQKAQSTGIETTFMLTPHEDFSALLGLSLNQTQYLDSLPNQATSATDNRVKLIPQSQGLLALNWQALENTRAQLAVHHTGSYYLDDANTQRYEGHTLLDLSLSFQLWRSLKLTAGIYNVADTRYAALAQSSIATSSSPDPLPMYLPGTPRTFEFGAAFSF